MTRISGIAVLAVVLLSACDQPTAPDGSASRPHGINASYVAAPGDAIAYQYCNKYGNGEGEFLSYCMLYVMNADGSVSFIENQDVANPWGDPPYTSRQTWSPDGSHIAYAAVGDIIATDLAASSRGYLTNDAASDGSPAWSPDGSRIAFVSDRDGTVELYLMNAADGSNITRLTNGAGVIGEGSPSWSPDGSRIAFDCEVDAGNTDICAINLDGTGLERLTSDPAYDGEPDFSPDGTRIAFTRAGMITVMNTDGADVRTLTEGSQPDWSPAGNRLTFVRLTDGGVGACDAGGYTWCGNYIASEFYIINADGTNEANLGRGSGPAWRPGASTVIDTPPVAEFTSSCTDLSCQFHSTSTDNYGVVSYAWTFGNGTTGTYSDPYVTYSATGTYTVTLVVGDFGGQTSSVTHTVSVVAPPPDDPPVAAFTVSCIGKTCTFDSSESSDDFGIVRRDWGFNDGMGPYSTDTVAVHPYLYAGYYYVRLVVYDVRGHYSIVYHEVFITNQPPVPLFTSSCTALDCTFNSSASTDDYGITSRHWVFGDGTSADGNTVSQSHHYANAGTYNVTLVAYDFDGRWTAVNHDVVVGSPPPDLPPVARFTGSCSDLTCSFQSDASSDDIGIASRAWTFGDGTSAGDIVAPNHTYSAGTWTVTLTVTDTKGQTNSVSQSVTATAPDAPPVARFTASCSGLTCSFQSSASSDDIGIASRAWTFGDGTSADNSVAPSHTYGAGGTFSVTLTVTDTKGQTNSVTQSAIAVDQPPVARFTASCSVLTCSFQSGTSSDDRGIVSRSWTFGDGTSAGDIIAPTHSYSATGAYQVTLVVTDAAGQTNTVNQTVNVTAPDAPPVARFTVSCSGLVCNFDSRASSDDVGIVSRSWSFGDGDYAGDLIAPSHTYGPGIRTYTATLTVTDAKGQSNSVSHSVPAVDQPPVARFTYTCAAPSRGQTTCTFDGRVSTDDVGISTYLWTVGGTPASTGGVLIATFKSRSTQVITLTVKDAAGQASSVTQTITAN